jgi:hypothetical protein
VCEHRTTQATDRPQQTRQPDNRQAQAAGGGKTGATAAPGKTVKPKANEQRRHPNGRRRAARPAPAGGTRTMKRLIATAALALTAGSLLAAEVVSENIVGYQTLDITPGKFNMLAVQWDAVGGDDLDIQAILADPLGAGLQGGMFATMADADELQVWDPTTSNYALYWLYDSGGKYPTWDGRWIDKGTGDPAAAPFAKGSAFWLLSKGTTAASLLSAGQAPAVGAVTNTLVPGKFNMIANPYPAPYALNGPLAPDLLAAGAQGGIFATMADADELQVWDPTTSNYALYWLYDSGGEYPTWDGRWIDKGTGDPTAAELPMGAAAWYLSKGSDPVDFVFVKPY